MLLDNSEAKHPRNIDPSTQSVNVEENTEPNIGQSTAQCPSNDRKINENSKKTSNRARLSISEALKNIDKKFTEQQKELLKLGDILNIQARQTTIHTDPEIADEDTATTEYEQGRIEEFIKTVRFARSRTFDPTLLLRMILTEKIIDHAKQSIRFCQINSYEELYDVLGTQLSVSTTVPGSRSKMQQVRQGINESVQSYTIRFRRALRELEYAVQAKHRNTTARNLALEEETTEVENRRNTPPPETVQQFQKPKPIIQAPTMQKPPVPRQPLTIQGPNTVPRLLDDPEIVSDSTDTAVDDEDELCRNYEDWKTCPTSSPIKLEANRPYWQQLSYQLLGKYNEKQWLTKLHSLIQDTPGAHSTLMCLLLFHGRSSGILAATVLLPNESKTHNLDQEWLEPYEIQEVNTPNYIIQVYDKLVNVHDHLTFIPIERANQYLVIPQNETTLQTLCSQPEIVRINQPIILSTKNPCILTYENNVMKIGGTNGNATLEISNYTMSLDIKSAEADILHNILLTIPKVTPNFNNHKTTLDQMDIQLSNLQNNHRILTIKETIYRILTYDGEISLILITHYTLYKIGFFSFLQKCIPEQFCIKICCNENNVNHTNTTIPAETQIVYTAQQPTRRVQFQEIGNEGEDEGGTPYQFNNNTKIIRFLGEKKVLRRGV
ncbi:hypothetical protein WN48_04487 [Eufriesea mexicana]|nr:hypothetical protein WN48_04487 [Eufriesea mexicana]